MTILALAMVHFRQVIEAFFVEGELGTASSAFGVVVVLRHNKGRPRRGSACSQTLIVTDQHIDVIGVSPVRGDSTLISACCESVNLLLEIS